MSHEEVALDPHQGDYRSLADGKVQEDHSRQRENGKQRPEAQLSLVSSGTGSSTRWLSLQGWGVGAGWSGSGKVSISRIRDLAAIPRRAMDHQAFEAKESHSPTRAPEGNSTGMRGGGGERGKRDTGGRDITYETQVKIART